MITRTQLAMGRFIGMSPEAREKQKETNETVIWYASCRKCKRTEKGTLAQLQAHRCDNG
jgi:hypothetical protein